MEGKPDRIRLGETSDGEPVGDVLDEGGRVLSRTVGAGSMIRSRFYGEEICPGERIVVGMADSEEGSRKLDQELRAEGAKRVGGDSPDIGRPTYGWTRRFGDRYDSIFHPQEPQN
jgi:hypothetical protein